MLGIDPLTQALLAASGGMLASSGPSLVPQSFGSAAGRGMLTGLNAYNDARIVNQKEALGNLHMQGMQQSLEDAKRSRAAIEAFAAQLPADQRGLFLANPQAYIKSATETRAVSPGQSLVRGNTPIYTAPPNLQPVDTGSGIMPWNPQTGAAGAAVIPKTMTPGESARHDWDRFTFNNLSAQQR
ncbi:MAG TPA: hypothetical protein VD994_03735, partial [Prosthecobacter sp.]|nr:hypothetical protein [Prosthecobacter sp.]